MQTLLLDQSAWDLVLDAGGNIAVASNPYSIAQDAASMCRLFLGELWYDTTQGVNFFGDILGKFPPAPLIKADLVQAALLVPDVQGAQVFIASIDNGLLSGQVQVSTRAGVIAVASF